MRGLLRRTSERAIVFLLAFFMMASAVMQYDVMKVKAAETSVVITESAGYEEGAYAEWTAVEGADGYQAYVSEDGTNYTAIDNELIRKYADYWRVDTVGLTAGTYYIKVEAVKVDAATGAKSVLASAVTGALSVINYDRSGFTFSSASRLGTGSGAYNDDGSLKDGAQVVYVTADTAKTCKATVNGTEQTGIQAILDAKQKKDTGNDILCIRIIGCVKADDVDSFSSSSEGIQIKGKSEYTPMNITIEGIGEDATVSGFGFLVRNCGNVEFRNFAIMNFMDDGISLDTANTNIWVHDMDFFYGSAGGDSDQAKGDGTVDMKGDSQYITVAYNHFWDAGKASLCGMKSETGENYITYHHNWFDHSDSRHPRIRTMSVHVYNNYYDGNSKYGVGAAYQSQAFVEANYFDNCKYPMLISKQGSDVATDDEGTFSGEDGGIIKAYNNVINGAQRLIYANSDAGTGAADAVEFDAYLATTRSEQVPSTYTAKQGGKVYNNFDTNVDLGVKESAIDAPEDVPTVVSAKAGRLNGGDFKWDLSAESEDTNYAVITELKAAIVNYSSSVVSIGGLAGSSSSGGDSGSTGGDGSGETGGDSSGDGSGSTGGETGGQVGGTQVHNFTESGKTSSFYTITGNLSTSKGTVTYNGLTLTQCLKMESSTNISFTAAQAGTLTLVFDAGTTKKVKVDGTKYACENGVFTIDLEAGEHTIAKADSINLFYMVFAVESADSDVSDGDVSGGDVSDGDVSGGDASDGDAGDVHTHDYGTTYKSDETNHWKECSCGEKSESAAHSFDWKVDQEATETVPGSKHEECTTCGYKKAAVEIPATGSAGGDVSDGDVSDGDVSDGDVSGGDASDGDVSDGDVTGTQGHNFTEGGKDSSFYTISGNLSTSKGTVTYNGMTLTQCLKMESATSISFTSEAGGALTLVFDTAGSIKVDGVKYTFDTNEFILNLAPGTHTITKADSINLFYMAYATGSGDVSGGDVSGGDVSDGNGSGGTNSGNGGSAESDSDDGSGDEAQGTEVVTSAPRTGDEAMPFCWLMLIMLCGICVICLKRVESK